MTRALKASERKHTLRFIEGPLLSDDGVELRFIVAVRNDSSTVWSSYRRGDGKFAVNIGSHIYSRNGVCLDYENTRTQIPFVLYPGQEIYVPVRVPTDWLAREATSIVVELVQEGVSWFGEGLKLELQQPPSIKTGAPEAEATALRPLYFRGPFGQDQANEQYFLFVMQNASHHSVRFENEDGQAQMRATLHDAQDAPVSGACVVSAFDVIGPGSYGFVCVFAAAGAAKESAALVIELDGGEPLRWRLDLTAEEFECVREAEPALSEPANDVSCIPVAELPDVSSEIVQDNGGKSDVAIGDDVGLWQPIDAGETPAGWAPSAIRFLSRSSKFLLQIPGFSFLAAIKSKWMATAQNSFGWAMMARFK